MENNSNNNIDDLEDGNQDGALKNVELVMMHTNNISSEIKNNLKKEIQSDMQPLDLLCITNKEVQKKKEKKRKKRWEAEETMRCRRDDRAPKSRKSS